LINGSSGIAVGMATNMLPHNLSEVIDGCSAYVDNREITIDELMQHVKAPDFPGGGIIYGMEGVKSAMHTGRGRVVLRGKVSIETKPNGREQIIITEVPYQVSRDVLTERVGQLVNDKVLDGITHVNNESSENDGTRIVIDLRKDAVANVIVNQLYKYTDLQTSYGINNVAIVKGRPRILNLKDLISSFIEFRHEVVQRRALFQLKEAEKKAHILQGYLIALDHLDEVIKLIRNATNPEEARVGLMSQFGMSEIQAKAVLELRLQRLTGMEINKIREEYEEIMKLINYLKDLLADETKRYDLIKTELVDVKEKFGDSRRTEITYLDNEVSIEDLIKEEDVVITVSHLGYIKRTPMTEYRTQSRGGVGAKAADKRNEDFMEHLFDSNTHDYLLLFTQKGRCYWIRVYELPEGNKTSKGRAIQNLLQLGENDKIKAFIRLENLNDKDFLENHFIIFATKHGLVKKTPLEAYSRPRTGGIAAISFREDDELIEAKLTKGNSQILLASKAGKAIRFIETDVRSMGRTATGVKGMDIEGENDELIGMVCVEDGDNKLILAVSEKGIGKRTDIDEYRIQTRGGKGIKTINVTDKTGQLISIKAVTDTDDLMIINKSGLTIRIAVKELPISGRATQGVKLINIKSGDSIADVSLIVDGQLEEPEIDESNTEA
jgi:DNA gyrase subunit A